VFAVATLLIGAAAAPIPFYDRGEPREALVVRAMLAGHGTILPRLEGGGIPSKPPLFHWLAALAMTAGVRPEELAIRLPSILFGAAGVALTAAVAGHASGVAAGILAGAVLGSSFEWFRAATQSRVDMTLTFFVVAAVFAWHARVLGDGSRMVGRLGWLCAAVATLAKGPVGMVLPLLVVGAGALAGGQTRRLRRLVDPGGMAGAAALAVGWYALAWASGGGAFLARHLVQENAQRFVGWGKVAHRHSALYYVPALLGALFPWSLALPVAVRRSDAGTRALRRFLVVWTLAVLGFYSLAAGKRSTYLLPLFPPLAILVGQGLADTLAAVPGPRVRRVLAAGAALLGVGAVVLWAGWAGPLIDALGPVFSGGDRERLPAVPIVLHDQRLAAGLTLAAAAGCVAVLAMRVAVAQRGRVLAVVGLALVWSLGLTAFGTYPLAARVTSRPLALRLRDDLGPGDRLCRSGFVDRAFQFYVARPVPRCHDVPDDGTGRTLVIAPAARTAEAGPHYTFTWRGGDAPSVAALPASVSP
jgi:4-amino-4-deoxy-L-arabinose transferase-like glycosyltransferase